MPAHPRARLSEEEYLEIERAAEFRSESQTEPRIEVFRRQGQGEWLMSESIGLDAVCRLEDVDCRIPLADIYDKVAFEVEEAPPRAAAEL